MTDTKKCSKCGEVKPRTQFHKQRDKKDGLHSICKSCKRAYDIKRFEANKELKAEFTRKWYQENKARKNETDRKWREANKERKAEKDRKWKQSNSDKVRGHVHRRRARKFCAVPQRWVKSECPETNCYWCGVDLSTVSVHVEHLMPLSLGGPAIKSNEAPACQSCNLSKNNKHPLVWLALQF